MLGGAACWGVHAPLSPIRGVAGARGRRRAARDPASEKGDGGRGGSRGSGCHLVMGGAGDGEGDHDPGGGKPTDGKLNPTGIPELA